MTIWLGHTCHNHKWNCSYLPFCRTTSPKFLKISMNYVFLTFFLPLSLLVFSFIFPSCFAFPSATTHHSTVNGLYNPSMCKFWCVFPPPIILNWRRNWQTVLTSLTFHVILTLENQTSLRHALTHFAKCSLAVLIFQVSHSPLSGNVIGLHVMWIFIIPKSLIINSGNQQSHFTSFCQNHS